MPPVTELERQYLLGRLSDSDVERLEIRLIEDEKTLGLLQVVEDDLIDDFARDYLSEPDREAFVRRYGENNPRVHFARAFARRTTNVRPFPRWLALAAAASAAIVFASWMATRVDAPDGRRVARAHLTSPIIHMVPLTLSASRDEGERRLVMLPQNASVLRLRILLDPAKRYDGYSVEVRSNGVTWRSPILKAIDEKGDLILAADMPAFAATDRKDATYEVAVVSGNEKLGFIPLQIQRGR